MKLTIFETLLRLPLFQGLGSNELMDIVNRTQMEFRTEPNGVELVKEGDICDKLLFLLDGKIYAETTNSNHRFILGEILSAPFVFQPECLFGLTTRFTKSFYVKDDAQLLILSKQTIVEQFFHYEIFHFNLLNLLSSQIQQAQKLLWKETSKDLMHKFVFFVQTRAIRPAGEKILKIKMEDLASFLGETRLNISRMLHALHEEKLIEINRKEIIIPALENLIIKISQNNK